MIDDSEEDMRAGARIREVSEGVCGERGQQCDCGSSTLAAVWVGLRRGNWIQRQPFETMKTPRSRCRQSLKSNFFCRALFQIWHGLRSAREVVDDE